MKSRKVFSELSKIGGIKIYRNASLKAHNTFRIDSCADLLVIPKTIQQLKSALFLIRKLKVKFIVIGNGSKILFPEKVFNGVVIKFGSGLKQIEICGSNVLVGAGVPLPVLIKKLSVNGIGGLEFASGVPASFGGAVVMNFGAFGKSIGNYIQSVKVLDEKNSIIEIKKNKLKFGYRKSNLLKKKYIVLQGHLKLKKRSLKLIKNDLKKAVEWRRQKQPLGTPNAGSIFKNPANDFAGRLIEKAGLAGRRIGDAQVSTKHANFIINLGSAKSSDILALMKQIKRRVKDKFGITLVPELNIIKS